ncbi:hypothetical protein [Metabacillus indicus]|uniref:hypothetical protein n=1 Tax=Metabacillus indicus TaxID=246786 RepID=UPI003CF56525
MSPDKLDKYTIKSPLCGIGCHKGVIWVSKKNNHDKKVKVKVIFLDERESDSLTGALAEGNLSDSLSGESAVMEFTQSLAGVTGEAVDESIGAATKHVSCENNYKKYFKEKYKHKYKRKYKKCYKKQKVSTAYGSLYNFELGSFALDGDPVNFTVPGPLRHVGGILADNSLKIKKSGVYEINFLADVMANPVIANFAFFINNTLIDLSRFSLIATDTIQTTIGKTVHLELEGDDEITVRTLDLRSPNVEYVTPAVQILNAGLTVKLLDQR